MIAIPQHQVTNTSKFNFFGLFNLRRNKMAKIKIEDICDNSQLRDEDLRRIKAGAQLRTQPSLAVLMEKAKQYSGISLLS